MKRLVVVAIVVGVAVALTIVVIGVRTVQRVQEQWSEPGAQARFVGTKALNRGVGLIELHAARYGRYPATLSDLKFLSSLDRAELGWLEYAASDGGDAYYLAIARELDGAEEITWPAEYWAGTGYDAGLRSEASRVDPDDLEAPEPTTFSEGFDDLNLAGVNLAVGHIELHRLRYGAYPEGLDDLRSLSSGDGGRVLGQSAAAWSNPSLAIVDYTLSEDGRSYEIRIKTPLGRTKTAGLPDAYWRGTGCAGGGP
jgi:hypothetical protein